MFVVVAASLSMFDVLVMVDDDVAKKYGDDNENNQTVEVQNILY